MTSPPKPSARRLVVSVFCGGRGASNLIREFLRRPDVELNALINAYDDGLSTGELRGFIPGMLGPSDFRKNLANFLHLHSTCQYAVNRLLEYRWSSAYSAADIARLRAWATNPDATNPSRPPDDLQPIMRELETIAPRIRNYLAAFFEYESRHQTEFRFEDCSLGNLIFAGAYLKNNRNFNAATAELAREFHSRATLINVTPGENRILAALKEDGEILPSEARVVAPQSPARIIEIYLLEKPLSPGQLAELQALPDVASKSAALGRLHRPVPLSPEARHALLHSDIIVYGPGTQFSSLVPSYRTTGIGEAISASRAHLKLFVVNIHRDHDIQGLTAVDLVRHALRALGDPENAHQSITHVLYTTASSDPLSLVARGIEDDDLRGLKWIEGEFENPVRPGVHSGYLAVHRIQDAYEETLIDAEPDLDIYIDLHERSLALQQVIQEFLELPWKTRFKKVRLRFNDVALPPLDLPPHLSVESTHGDGIFSEVGEVGKWAKESHAKFIVTLSGDGEYRLCDILYGMEILAHHPFAAVYGSRKQSRHQFYKSLDSAYGESPLLHTLSLVGAFIFSFLFALRFGEIFSDPFTGFRLYNRSSLAPVLAELPQLQDRTPTGITKLLMRHGCEIAEMPVSYRTFEGFTNTRWRLQRGFYNAWRIFF